MNAQKKKKVEQVLVPHGDFPSCHEPLCKATEDCFGCAEYRWRRNRNTRAGRVVGVEARLEAQGACHSCKVPVFRGWGELSPCWAWNQDIDRAQWSVEEARTEVPPMLCPRCRAKAA